jgi:hypothetical protein
LRRPVSERIIPCMANRLTAFRGILLDSCRKRYGNRLVSLAVFGSWARGRATPESDIDVLLVADDLPGSRRKRVAEFSRVETDTDAARRRIWSGFDAQSSLSPVIKTPEEVKSGGPIFLDMTDWCDVLFDEDGFLRSYLDELRTRMARLGTRRHRRKGGYYWEYKPGLRPKETVTL